MQAKCQSSAKFLAAKKCAKKAAGKPKDRLVSGHLRMALGIDETRIFYTTDASQKGPKIFSILVKSQIEDS